MISVGLPLSLTHHLELSLVKFTTAMPPLDVRPCPLALADLRPPCPGHPDGSIDTIHRALCEKENTSGNLDMRALKLGLGRHSHI